MTKLNLIWVNMGTAPGLREASTSGFASACSLRELDVAELARPDLAHDCDTVCFNFDYPDMSGLKVVCETKRRWPSVPVLMLAMQGSVELALWALRARVFDLLIKPVTDEERDRCLQRIQAALQGRRSQSERKPCTVAPQLPPETRYRPHSVVASRLELAKAHVSKHFAQNIPESQVAALCEMSPSRFCREFKAAYGVTFVEYLANYRVKQAKRLLRNPNISVADAAAAVGFSDPSYFARVFRKQVGVAPTEYRESAPTVTVPALHIGS